MPEPFKTVKQSPCRGAQRAGLDPAWLLTWPHEGTFLAKPCWIGQRVSLKYSSLCPGGSWSHGQLSSFPRMSSWAETDPQHSRYPRRQSSSRAFQAPADHFMPLTCRQNVTPSAEMQFLNCPKTRLGERLRATILTQGPHALPHTFIHTAPRIGQRLLKGLEMQRQTI